MIALAVKRQRVEKTDLVGGSQRILPFGRQFDQLAGDETAISSPEPRKAPTPKTTNSRKRPKTTSAVRSISPSRPQRHFERLFRPEIALSSWFAHQSTVGCGKLISSHVECQRVEKTDLVGGSQRILPFGRQFDQLAGDELVYLVQFLKIERGWAGQQCCANGPAARDVIRRRLRVSRLRRKRLVP